MCASMAARISPRSEREREQRVTADMLDKARALAAPARRLPAPRTRAHASGSLRAPRGG
jgi:hypothetical protein